MYSFETTVSAKISFLKLKINKNIYGLFCFKKTFLPHHYLIENGIREDLDYVDIMVTFSEAKVRKVIFVSIVVLVYSLFLFVNIKTMHGKTNK